jgi:predicted CXXCH cytochrome family protein
MNKKITVNDSRIRFKAIKRIRSLLILLLLLAATVMPASPDLSVVTGRVIAATHSLGVPMQTGKEVNLSWANDSTATGYHVYRTTNQGMIRLTGAVPLPAGTTVYKDNNNIKDDTIYQYEVAAIISGKEEFSNAQSLHSKIPPEKNSEPITVTANSYYVDITWGPTPSSDLAYYEIYRNGGIVGRTLNTSYRDLGVSPSTSYSYSIKAVDHDGLRSDSYTSVSAVTSAAAPATQVKTLLTENFAGQWVKNPSSSTVLTLGGNAYWRLAGKGATNTTSAELSSSFPFSVEASPNKAEVTFDWIKNWGNDDSRANEGENVDVYLDYMAVGGTWTEIWSETALNRGSGKGTVQITNTKGSYLLRFRTALRNSSRDGDWTEATIDNVVIKQTVANTAPQAPTSLTGMPVNGNTVSLTWTPPSDTDLIGYKIFRKPAEDANYPSAHLATTSTTNFVDASAQPGINYNYKVTAVDSGNLSSTSVETTLKTPAGVSSGDKTPPKSSGNLRTVNIGAASVELAWDASPTSEDVSQYGLLRSTDGISYTIVSTLPALTTIDKSLQASTGYFYRVIALDEIGNPSPPSNLLAVRTNSPDVIPPSSPGGFAAEIIGETYVKFKWSAAADNERVDRYEIEMDQGGWVKKGEFFSPSTVGTIEGLLPGHAYNFRIIAYDSSNNASQPVNLPAPGSVTTKVDTTPPTVKFKRPGEGTVSIGTKESLLIRFDDILKKESVNSSTVKVIYNPPVAALTYTPGETIAGTYEFNSETAPTEVTFIPAEPLQQETTYEVRINGVENISGTPMEEEVWVFTTGTSEFVQPHGNYTENTVFCSMCHDTHEAVKPRLLKNSVQEVCMSCHNGLGSSFNTLTQFEKDGTKKGSHHPVYENTPGKEEGVQLTCVSCHDPHDGGTDLDTGESIQFPRLLSTINKGNETASPPVPAVTAHEGNGVCWNCHGNEANGQYSFGLLDGGKIINPPNGSGPSYGYRGDHQTYYPSVKGHASLKMDAQKGTAETEGGAGINCVACHEKHGSDVKPLLRPDITGTADPSMVNGKEFCYQCHTSYLDLSNSDNPNAASASYDGKAINEERGHAQFDCQVCHNPHGSPYPNNLRLNYRVDTSSWRAFNAKDAELCFDCHDQSKLLTKGAALRGRTDRGNLHGYHINSQQAGCKNCHRPHGAIYSESGVKLNHKVGFPSSQVSGKTYNRDAQADDSLQGGSGSCSLNCHDSDHSGDNYDGAFRSGAGISNFNSSDAYMLKNNWKSESVLLNTRPDGTGIYDFGEYKIDYRNGPVINGSKSHFRDAGLTPGDGYLWK